MVIKIDFRDGATLDMARDYIAFDSELSSMFIDLEQTGTKGKLKESLSNLRKNLELENKLNEVVDLALRKYQKAS